MSNIFKLCATHFSRGAKHFLGVFVPPVTPLVTGLRIISTEFRRYISATFAHKIRYAIVSQGAFGNPIVNSFLIDWRKFAVLFHTVRSPPNTSSSV